jgi:hypothetical protein
MSYDEYTEPDGYCEDCGQDLDEDPGGEHDPTHRRCWACWRKDQGLPEQPWRQPRPAPGTPPTSFVVGLAQVRRELDLVVQQVATLTDVVARLAERVRELELELELERRRAA